MTARRICLLFAYAFGSMTAPVLLGLLIIEYAGAAVTLWIKTNLLAVIATREKARIKMPIVIRMVGTNEEEGRRILEEAGIPFLDSMEEGAREAVARSLR